MACFRWHIILSAFIYTSLFLCFANFAMVFRKQKDFGYKIMNITVVLPSVKPYRLMIEQNAIFNSLLLIGVIWKTYFCIYYSKIKHVFVLMFCFHFFSFNNTFPYFWFFFCLFFCCYFLVLLLLLLLFFLQFVQFLL